MQRTDVAIIGAGQAGLAMSACLGQAGVDHLVLERGRIGERWRSERRASLRLLTPAWMMRLPGLVRPDVHPESFLPIGDFAALLEHYAAQQAVPLLAGCDVQSVMPVGGHFRLRTSFGEINARSVVVATGACDLPNVPAWASALPSGAEQLAADAFRGALHLPPGGVLVIGSSATGMQIAAELAGSGRRVTLAVGRHVRAPRRYRGRDLFAWLDAAGFLTEPRPADAGARLTGAPSLPLVGGAVPGGGMALELTRLSASGIRVVGRVLGAAGQSVYLAKALDAEVEAAERRRRKLLTTIDRHIAMTGDDAASDPAAWLPPPALPPAPARLDLSAEAIGSVVWATGYRRAYPWLRVPVIGPDGEIVQSGGVTPVPGLYVLGLPFMRHRASALIDGVGRDAAALATHIARQLGVPASIAA